MTMTVVEEPMTEYLFSVYGTSVRYATASPLLAPPVNELLRHFRRDSLEESVPALLVFSGGAGTSRHSDDDVIIGAPTIFRNWCSGRGSAGDRVALRSGSRRAGS